MLLLWIICVVSVLFLLCFRVRLFYGALRLPAGRGLASWLSFVMSNCEVITFTWGILSQVRCLIVSITDLCPLSYFYTLTLTQTAYSIFTLTETVYLIFTLTYTVYPILTNIPVSETNDFYHKCSLTIPCFGGQIRPCSPFRIWRGSLSTYARRDHF